MRVLVGIPWREQQHRVYAHTATVEHYRGLLPDADIVDVDTDHTPFCLAACRNKIARMAEDGGYDVVVIGDADTLPEPGPLHAAITAATTDHRVHLPYTEYRSLRKTGTDQHKAGTPLPDCDHVTVATACSGVYVTTPATWWACGGQDEQIRGWGMEDVCWLAAHRTLIGEPARHDGRVYALHHRAAPKRGKQYDANVARYHTYLAAAEQGPQAVRELTTVPPPAPRALIIAAGDGTRWGNHLGVPKHLARLCGEPILHRTVRLASRYTDDIVIVVSDLDDTRYDVPPARRELAKLNPANHDADKFLSSRHLWADDRRTVILYGDVFFTDDAMRRIFDPRPHDDGWHAYVRFDASHITGAPGGENFAHVIDPPAHHAYETNLHRIVRLRQDGTIWRNGGWEQYRAMAGLPDDQLLHHADHGHATVIDDWTEDLDYPADWDGWCWRWAHTDPAHRPAHHTTTP